ncbi:raffinose/stachyose/melibiose transport system permease protein [Paenibacillus sp. V4I9]|uniref:carbohydrate ABC transporter permease n=1 Tax=Paenibacillus sp. V4I9 TaxID=3042308 RepID=UPI0027822CD2|nr:carbohydrate ABC transporter permease [Paenibacillus sp. V4I9]MDQ0885993.1 raffinose/stachyose/melibiose transport system permease protein [Paenibacillus sp. V4I9]
MEQGSKMIRPIQKLFTYLFLGLGTLVYIYPLFWLIVNSLKKTPEIFERPWELPLHWLWGNYINAWITGGTGRYFYNSVLITTVTLLLVLLIGSMASFAIIKLKWKASKGTLLYFLIGLMVPLQATLIPLVIFFSKLNLMNSQIGLILIYVAFALPTSILVLSGFMSSIPKEIMEAAIIDGCSVYGVYWRVLMPLLIPALMTVGIMNFAGIWNELLVVLTFINDAKKMTLPIGLLNFQGQYATDFAPMFAAIVMTTLPSILVISIFNKRIISGITAGSLKG